MRVIFFDIEVYPNLFVVVFYDPYLKEYKIFILWELNGVVQQNDILKLKKYLGEEKDTYFCGYNSLGYDMQILTQIINKNLTANKEIKDFNDYLISQEWPVYREWDLCNKTMDLMLINNFSPRSAKSTSLKKLEFNLRKKKIADLPYHFNDLILKDTQVAEIIKYCQYDVEVTKDVFNLSKELINLRIEFEPIIGESVINSAEPDLAKKFVYRELANYMGIDVNTFKKLRTYHENIDVKDLILPFISFTKSHYKEVLDYYNSLKLTSSLKSNLNSEKKLINLKNSVSKVINYDGLETVYGSGGR